MQRHEKNIHEFLQLWLHKIIVTFPSELKFPFGFITVRNGNVQVMNGIGDVPHRVMWMHLYGPGSSSWPAAGEGVDEASYHRTPACSPKLIQGVPDQTEEIEGNIQHPNLLWKDGGHSVFVQTVCWRSVADLHQQCRQLFQKERLWGCFDYLAVAGSVTD